MDPLHVLRCDPGVLRCAVTLEIVLHMLRALLAASRTQLTLHLSENCAPDAASAADRDELRVALVAAQESAAVQILLEVSTASCPLVRPSGQILHYVAANDELTRTCLFE